MEHLLPETESREERGLKSVYRCWKARELMRCEKNYIYCDFFIRDRQKKIG